MERRLAAILAVDVVGYSRLIEADEEGTLVRLKTLRNDLIDPIIGENNGRIVKLMGDGALIEFGSIVDAVRCAIAIQRDIAAHNADIPKRECFEFRMGINLGDIVVEDDDIYGDGVNIAARLEGLAEAGGICVSGTAFDHVKTKLDVGFEFLGEQQVKNLSEPVRTYRVLLDGKKQRKDSGTRSKSRLVAYAIASLFLISGIGAVAWLSGWLSPVFEQKVATAAVLSMPQGPSIAVLPFDNMTGDQEQEFFVDGITEEIIAELTKFRDLHVLARNSTFKYKDKPISLRTVGQELGVQYLVEGSVRRSADTVRITAQLIDAKSEAHLWAETFERRLTATNLFNIQDEITGNIVGSIGGSHGNITRAGIENIRSSRTENLDAYECLLRAREYHATHTEQQHLIARNCLERAVELDPTYVEAIAELAYIYVEEYRHDWNLLPNALDRSLKTATRALELDPNNQTVHWALALTYFSQRKLGLFYAEARRAVEINPNNTGITGFIAHFMTPTGKWEEGTALMKRTMEINPDSPSWYNLTFFFDLFRKAEYEAALEKLHQSGLRNYYMVQMHYASIYGKLGRKKEAAEAVAKLRSIVPGFTIKNAYIEYETKRSFEPKILEHLIDGLRKAGLPE